MRVIFALLLTFLLVGPGAAHADEKKIDVPRNVKIEVTIDLTLMPYVCCPRGYWQTIGVYLPHKRHEWRASVEEQKVPEHQALAKIREVDRSVHREKYSHEGIITIPLNG